MKGYKLAIGIDKVKGPFPVIVVLDIPEDATVVVPVQKVALDNHPTITKIRKLRSDRATVVDMYPLDKECTDWNWNRLAFSAYELNYMEVYCDLQRINTIYKIGKDIVSDITMDEKESCGTGIHYFESEEDMMLYYDYDLSHWFREILEYLELDWYSQGYSVYARDIMIKLSEVKG